MLKNCWECVMGSRIENEVYDTVLNGHAQNTAWPETHRQNETMFRIPKSLQIGDEIEINGKLQQNPQRFRLNLTTGGNRPDFKNVACQIEASFAEDKFYLRDVVNGQIVNESQTDEPDLIGQFPADEKFNFRIEVKQDGELYLNVKVFESSMGSKEIIKHNLEDITFLTVDGDYTKIEDLKFTYG